MKKTLKERAISKLGKLGKKYKLLKLPLMICMVVVLQFFYIMNAIAGNTKKLVSFACLLLFFFVGSSFSSIGFVTTTDVTVGTDMLNASESTDEINIDEIELLDDKDVVDGYEDTDVNSSHADLYTVDEILDSKNMINKEIPVEEAAAETPVLNKDDWQLLLINKQHPVPDGYEFSLGTIKGSMQCDRRILEDLLSMLQGAKEDNISLVICSPYRDLNRQETLFNKKVNAYMKSGLSYMEAYKVSSQTVTVPGASEHQVGLALDIVCDSYSSLTEGFGETEAGKWLAEHSCEYGFILRYPKGKEYITGIEFEPWHFRYVGREAAMIIKEKGITLEEFVEDL